MPAISQFILYRETGKTTFICRIITVRITTPVGILLWGEIMMIIIGAITQNATMMHIRYSDDSNQGRRVMIATIMGVTMIRIEAGTMSRES